MRPDTTFEGDDLRRIDPKFQPPRYAQYLDAVRRLDELAQRRFQRRVIHLAVRWMLDQGISVALWGGASPRSVEAALGVAGWSLDAEHARSDRSHPEQFGRRSCRPRVHGTAAARLTSNTENDMKIGFIGLGRMGAAMASNLVKAGHEVTVFNRSSDKRRALVQLGAHEATDVAGACHGEAVITMLADDAALTDIALGDGGLITSLPKGAIHSR